VSQWRSAAGKVVVRAWYACHGITLQVEEDGLGPEPVLAPCLEGLSWRRTTDVEAAPHLCMRISVHHHNVHAPHGVQPLVGLRGFQGVAAEHGFYFTDGGSLMLVQPERGQVYAQLAPDFFCRAPHSQQIFWTFALLKLLRPLGIYWLHAAGVLSPEGLGTLIIGPSGSGKSTLTIGLIRQGWSYLSDDALLLHRQPEGIAGLAWRRDVSIDAAAAEAYADLPLGEAVGNAAGGYKRRVGIQQVYPGQALSSCRPRALLFSRVEPHSPSALRPLDRATALKRLLDQSGPALFDRDTMETHLELLRQLLRQATPYELRAGFDLYHDPHRLLALLGAVKEESRAPAADRVDQPV
jgi:hypothetical protein